MGMLLFSSLFINFFKGVGEIKTCCRFFKRAPVYMSLVEKRTEVLTVVDKLHINIITVVAAFKFELCVVEINTRKLKISQNLPNSLLQPMLCETRLKYESPD